MTVVIDDEKARLRRRLALDGGLIQAALDAGGLRPAAVLVPIIDRPMGLSVLLTQRAAHLSAHAGQISFPGGRIEPTDETPIAAALREAQEEIGLDPRFVEPIGFLDIVETGTGFRIAPVVAFIQPIFDVTAHPAEVALIFEVPLDFLMNPANHQKLDRSFAIPYGAHHIWGATARMLINLYEKVFR